MAEILDYDESFVNPDVREFFSRYADLLIDFADRHNLQLWKYYHEAPSWRFNFRHPKGGAASIDVQMEKNGSVSIETYWWVDSFDEFTRSLKHRRTGPHDPGDSQFVPLLETKLEEILAWQPGNWDQVATGYRQIWEPQGRDWIEKDVEKYPFPRTDEIQ